ncbi:uncharacterized protein LOC143283203 isoform X2 [Babylonia areolata]|uniref:uncharacterized protein LOC143283203 isoform X2 n=1 Tax=Babylonia areolata TaxID=304850 RepID=UPI003FD6B1C7
MADFDGDLEKAFTNGDPEAVLDFLVLRSQEMLRGEEEEEVDGEAEWSVPLFTSDTDMAAFVRDLTIDDAIAHCFADLPSGSDVTATSSAPSLLPTRPEKKLTGSKVSPEAGPTHKHSLDASRRYASVKQPPSSQHAPNSANHSPRGKSRGFLSSLLGRGYKGRRGGSERKPSGRPHDYVGSSKGSGPPFGGLAFEKDVKKTPVDPVVGTRVHPDGSTRVPMSGILLDDVTSVCPQQAVNGRHQRTAVGHTHRDSAGGRAGQRAPHATHTASVTEYHFSHSTNKNSSNNNADVSGSVGHKLETAVRYGNPMSVTEPSFQSGRVAAVGVDHYIQNTNIRHGNELTSSNICAHTLSKRREGNDPQVYPHPRVHGVLGLPPKPPEKGGSDQRSRRSLAGESHPQKTDPLSAQTTPQTPSHPAPEKTETTPDLPSSAVRHTQDSHREQKPWEGLCAGIDAFIDFERDPNLEVPLDSHLSAQFGFERRSDETCPLQPRGQEQQAGLVTQCLVSQTTSQAPPSTVLQAPAEALESAKRLPGARDERPATQPSSGSTFPACASETAQRVAPRSHAPLPAPATISASTQTECQSPLLGERRHNPMVGQCLRTAITQLSSLAACASCDDVIARTLVGLKKALVEVEEENASTDNPAHPGRQAATTPGGPAQHGRSITEEFFTETQADNAWEDRTPSDSLHVGPPSCGFGPKQTDEPATRVSHDVRDPDPQTLRGTQENRRDTDPNPKSRASVSSQKHPEHSARRSVHQSGVGKQKMTSSVATPADSDSDSTSTVTSEPITVLVCQRGTRSASSEASSGGRLPDKTVSASRSFSVDVDGGKAVTADLPSSVSTSGEDATNPAPALDLTLGRAKTENMATTTTKSVTAMVTALPPSRATPYTRKSPARSVAPRYAGEADRDYESFMTSSWSEMTSVSSVSDVVTSADESSYYSGDDDDNDEDDDDDDDEEDDDDVTAVVRLGLLDEDRDDSELRQHRLQRHLAAVLRQNSVPPSTVETVVAATGERLNGLEMTSGHVSHVNQGSLYPFSSSGGREPATFGTTTGFARGDGGRARSFKKAKKGVVPRLFSPERQVSLIPARQMTSEEFREAYDRSTDLTKVKRSQLDADVPWDLIPCSDTDDDAGSEKAWYNVTSEEESLARAYGSDTDSSTTVSDW